MPYRGHVDKGAIVVDEPIALPDGTVVELRPVRLPAGQHHPDVERFAGRIPPDIDVENEYFEYIKKKHA